MLYLYELSFKFCFYLKVVANILQDVKFVHLAQRSGCLQMLPSASMVPSGYIGNQSIPDGVINASSRELFLLVLFLL